MDPVLPTQALRGDRCAPRARGQRSAGRPRPRRIGVPAHHEQPYSQVVLKIRLATGGSSIVHLASRESTQVGGRCLCAGNRKGCDVGYVPAIYSCERAYGVNTCTVAALDAIAAFAVPNPGSSSQSQPVFSGLVALQVALTSRSLSLLRTGKFDLTNPFSRRRDTN